MPTVSRLARVVTCLSAALALSCSLGGAAATTAVEPLARADRDCAPGTGNPAVGSARGGTLRADDYADLTAQQIRQVERRLDRELASRGRGLSSAARAALAVRVPVHVHVIDGTSYRGPSKAEVNAQIGILNGAYSGAQSATSSATGYSFFGKSFHRVRKQRWLVAGLNRSTLRPDGDSREMRRRLNRGGPAALNMYFTKPGGGLLGYSSFPWAVEGNPAQDGVTVHSESMSGGGITGYNHGDTAVHEVGHWLGTYHTFEGRCSDLNDTVEDTPAEYGPSLECDPADTCSDDPGMDPIHNFMDYSFDTCMNMFTDGQADRMDDNWLAFRAGR